MKKISEWINSNKGSSEQSNKSQREVQLKHIDDFVIDKKVVRIINDFLHMGVHVAITGHPGTGKTELAKKIAMSFEMPYILINVGAIRSPSDWWGFMEYEEGVGTRFHKTRLTRALESGEPHVIILNEFNRCPSHCHNTIYDILDGNRSFYIEALDQLVNVHPQTMFLATLNRGMAHSGTFQEDAAIEDRFEFIYLQLPSEKEIAELLVKWFGIDKKDARLIARLTKELARLYEEDLLSKTFGMRPAINAAKLLSRGNSIHDALLYTFANRFSREGNIESEYTYVLQIIQGLAGTGDWHE